PPVRAVMVTRLSASVRPATVSLRLCGTTVVPTTATRKSFFAPSSPARTAARLSAVSCGRKCPDTIHSPAAATRPISVTRLPSTSCSLRYRNTSRARTPAIRMLAQQHRGPVKACGRKVALRRSRKPRHNIQLEQGVSPAHEQRSPDPNSPRSPANGRALLNPLSRAPTVASLPAPDGHPGDLLHPNWLIFEAGNRGVGQIRTISSSCHPRGRPYNPRLP